LNGRERIQAALTGRQPDRVPVMLHNFMPAAREAGVSMRQYRSDPAALARVHIQAVETYGLDAVLVDIDTCTLAGALGVPVEFPDDRPAVAHHARIESLAQLDELPPPNIAKYPGVQVWLEAVRQIHRHFGDEIYVRGNCDQCPFALAALMRGMQGWLLDIMDEDLAPQCARLLDYCAEAGLQFLTLMSQAGAHMLSNGDSAAGPSVVSPRIYRRWALPWERRFAERAHALGLPWALHVCGNTRAILPDLAACGADALELDYLTDVQLAHDLLKDRITFIGNIDPSAVVALGTPADVEREARALISLFADTPRFILNAGCALPASTPAENIHAIVRAR
jgi:uroporphyrinogen decarboxylase